MCAYNKVNGTYASQHRWLLTEVLRDEWGFDGLVVSDWGAVHDRVAALPPGWTWRCRRTSASATRRSSPRSRRRARRGACSTRRSPGCCELVDRARPRAGRGGAVRRRTPTTRWPGRRRRECAVLLKNDGGCCRCDPRAGDSDRGDRRVRPHAALPGRRQLAGQPDPGRRRRWTSCAPACRTGSRSPSPPASASSRTERRRARWPTRRSRWPAGADVVVVVPRPAGRATSRRASTARTSTCPPNQTRAAGPARRGQPAPGRRARQRLGGRGSPTGSTTRRAVLECWLSGQAAGGAVADLLLGAANPSGRLAETHPAAAGGQPVVPELPRRGRARALRRGRLRRLPRLRRARPARSATRSGTACPTPRFAYSDLDVRRARVSATDGDLAVDGRPARVTNTGARDGNEVVQLYVGDPEASVARPVRELKAFAKVALDRGRDAGRSTLADRP